MINKNELILVAGATGQRGGTVARHLLQNGYRVRAMTLQPEKAQDLRNLGADVVTADMTSKTSLNEVFRGVSRVFLVTTPRDGGVDTEIKQGTTMVDVARDTNITHLVYCSISGANRNTAIPHFDSKHKIESHIRQLGLPMTILRPVFLMDNFGVPWIFQSLTNNRLRTPLRPERNLQMISVDDIALMTLTAFEQPDKFIGNEIDIAADEMTCPDALRIISQATNRTIDYEQMPYEETEKTLGRNDMLMYRWLNEVGYNVNIPGLEKQWGVRLTRFKQYVTNAQFVKDLKARRAA
jgi:uncharacterized protein YbjT (DUF2867 family)